MAKTAAISLRVEPAFKAVLEAEAAKEHRTLATYVERRLLATTEGRIEWKLCNPHPVNSRGRGPQVALMIAEGWPTALITAEHAENLGRQLIKAAEFAHELPPAE